MGDVPKEIWVNIGPSQAPSAYASEAVARDMARETLSEEGEVTRRRDIMCEDIFECDHSPETPVVDSVYGDVAEWRCRCGRVAKMPTEMSAEPAQSPATTSGSVSGSSQQAAGNDANSRASDRTDES